MRTAKRLLSLFTAAAIAMSTFVSYIAPASAAVGDVVTVLENTLKDATTITDTEAYTWGADVAGIVTADGMKITNENDAANNYEGKSFVTFTNAVGDETHQVDITYNGYSVKDKGQAATISTMSYYDADGNFLFGIGESSGSWSYSASLTYADTATTTATVALPAAHIAKGSGSQAAINVVYTADGGMVTVDGGTSYAFVGGGIKDIKLSVSGGQDYSRYTCISNYKMTTTEVEAVVAADYTINYQLDGETVKTVSDSSLVGEKVTAETIVWNNDAKYYAADDATLEMTLVDGENVLNVAVREAEKYAVTITQNLGGTVVDYKADTAVEGEAYSCYWPAYVKDAEDVWYKADDTTSYGVSVAAASEAITKEVAYTAVEGEVIAYMEGEDADVTAGSGNVIANAAFSNGSGKQVMNSTTAAVKFTFTAPVTGTYTLSAPLYNSNSKSRGYALYIDDSAFTTTAVATAELTSATAGAINVDVDLKAGEHTVYYATTYMLTPDIDYLLVELKEAAAQYDVTVNATENGTATTAFATAAEGDTVTVLTTPEKDYAVDTITVTAADGTDITVTDSTFTMPAQAVTIDVTFKYNPPSYDVTVNADITNGTATTDAEKAIEGATVTITATPAEGYRVASYEVTAADTTAVEVTGNTFVMPAQAVTVSVIFELIPVSAVTVEAAENGTVTADAETAAEGSTVTVTATPAEGYKLKAITVTAADGSAVAVTKGKFTMPAQAVTVTATFREKFEDQTVSNIEAAGFTYVNAVNADTNYSDAGVVYAHISKISGGAFQEQNASYGGTDIALMKFDLSEYAGAIKEAKLTFTATCVTAGKNSQLNVASTDADWDAATVTWNTMPGNAVLLNQPGYAGDAGATFTVDVSDYVSDDTDGIVSFGLYTSTGRQQAITAPSMEIFISDAETTSVTVNNVVGGEVIKTYTVEELDVGDSYTANAAQLGYKLIDGKYYFPAETATTTIEALALEDNVLNIEFVASEEKIAVYEDFANIADTWGFTAGKDNSVVLGEGVMKLTQIGATSGDANEYGYYYSDVKELGTAELTKGTLVIEWASDVEGNKNRKNAFEIVDSNNNVVLGLISQAAMGSSDTLPAGVTYQVGAKATETSTNIAGSGWASGNSGIYTITLDFDFTGETGKVSGSIKGGVANADITIAETEVTATNIAKLVASDVYSAAPQSLYSVKVVDDSPVAPTTYDVTVAEATNGTVTVDKAAAAEGETVTITIAEAEGYEVDTITVTDADGAAVTVTDNAFVMPAKAVTVTVTFKEATETPVDPTTYAVTVAEATNGTVTVDKTTAEAGATVTITATANDGYEVDTITVTDADGAAVTVTDNAFVMPAKAVTVTVTFKATEAPVDPTAVIDFTNRTLTYEAKGSATVFEVTDAATAGATALAAAGAGNVLKLGSSQNGASKMLGYKADFAKEGDNTVVYSGKTTMSFKLEPMQVRTDKAASIELAFADINGNKILPITVATGATAGLTVNGTAATGIAYGNYYVVTYTMDFAAQTASVTIDAADGTNCLTISDVAITATNLTQLYRADSDWLYGYCAIDDIAVEAEEIGVPVFYTIVINAERYAKLTTSDGAVYYADVNGKIEIPLQKPGTAFDYTLSKVGYESVTGTVEALTADFEDTKTMTKSSEDIIFIESEFGNATEAYVSPDGMRNDSISIGTATLPEMSEVTVDMTFNGFGANSGQQKTWALVSDAGALVGLQFSDNGIYAWTGWTGSTNWNQSSDIGTYTMGERLGDLTTGNLTFKFVIDTTSKSITVSYGDVSKSLTYSVEATAITGMQTGLYRYFGGINTNEIVIAKPDENYLAINGVSGVAKVSGQVIEREYALSQTVIVADEVFTWTVADAEGNAIEGVTIENGVLKVADTATPGTAVITCVGSSSAEKIATFNVTIGDFQQVTLVVDGPQSYDVTETSGQYTVVSAKDSFGDEVKDIVPAVVWTSSEESVITVDAATGVSTVVGAGDAVITATITNGTAVSTATIPVTVATYYIVAEATGDSTVVDITNIVDSPAITGYQVTTTKDGAIVNQTVVAKADVTGGTATSVAAAAGEKIVATYDENGAITSITSTAVAEGDVVDFTAAENTKVFFWNSLNGMAPVDVYTTMEPATITVDTTGATTVEVAPVYQTTVGTLLAIPAATYNITVTANNGARTDVYANEQMLINNLNQGSDNWTVGRVIAASTDYEVEDIVIDQGYVKFKMYDDKSNGSTITKVTFAKVPDSVTRAKRIYTIGDSLVAAYYGEAPEGQEGLVRTGWGQVFDLFVKDEVGVTNLGNSGAEAVGMLGAAFTNVKESAKEGDIVIWESGYNDRSYSTVEKMKAAITEAYEYCVANGIEFYVVNPNASSHDYNASVVWASHIRDLATETGMPLIDLSQKSYDFLNGMYAEVEDVHTLLRTYYNNSGDTLHSSYNAANCWAAIVAQGLYDAGHSDCIDTTYSYTFNDGIQDVTVQVTETAAEETPAE